MFPKQSVSWLAILGIAATTLLSHADVTRADSRSWSDGCGCSEALPATSGVSPQPSAFPTRPFWMRPTPAYKSSWKRVPVTNYQTQVINDPLSGVAVTTVQPCSTYESQLRRTAGCSLWQRFVRWWRSRCSCFGRPSSGATTSCPPTTSCPQATGCPPTSEWVIRSSEPTAAPYYAPPATGRLVPVPSSVSPTSPAPADRRPQLDPVPLRSGGEGSASRSLLRHDREVFVRTHSSPAPSLELGPPLVAPLSRDAAEVTDDLEHAPTFPAAEPDGRTAAVSETSRELVPVSWSIPTPRDERKLPTDEVWDDSGWVSAR